MIRSPAAIVAALLATHAAAAAAAETPEDVAARLVAAPVASRARQVEALDGDLLAVTRALLALGDEAATETAFPRAVAAYDLAGVLAQRAGADAELGHARNGAAEGWFRQGEFDRTVALAEEGVLVHDALGDGAGLAQAWNLIGNVRWSQGRMQDALEIYERTLALWTASGDRVGVARAHNNIGQVKRNTGASDEALEHFRAALAVFEELGDQRRAAVVIDNIGIVHYWRGEYAAALEESQRGLAIREPLGDRYWIAKSLDTIGSIYRGLGDYARALDHLQRSLQLRTAVNDKHGVVETSHNLGLVYFAQGDYARAIQAYKRGLQLNAELKDASFEAEALLNIGAAAWRLHDRARAEANLRASLRIAERNGFWFVAGEAQHALGEIALALGRTYEAQALFGRALDTRAHTKDQGGIAATMTSLGSVALAERRFADAAVLAARAAALARANDQPEQLLEAQTVEGIAYRRLGRVDDARRALTDATSVVEGLRLQLGGAESARARFLARRLSPYHELVALAAATGDAPGALETAERAKARVLADLLRRGRAGRSRAITADERAEERRRRSALIAVNERLQQARAQDAPDAERIGSLVAERDALRGAYEAFQDGVYAAHPELRRERAEEPPFQFADAGRLLAADDVAVLEYVVTDSGAYLFVLTREGGRPAIASYAIPAGADALRALVDRFRGRIAARALDFAEPGRRLYDLLLAPARARIAGRTRLVIVPDGALWDVPFQALVDPQGRYLVESAAVAYAPSLKVLREIGQRPDAAAPNLLAVGKSEFGNGLAPLPDADAQVRRVAALYADRATVLLGADAREDRFKAEAGRYSVLHLATHGVLDESSPLYSHVVLAPGEGGSREDGLLEAWELLDMDLHADVVVLSACETGRGRIAPGEGVVGTMWALFVAGARAMVVSLWPVESGSTTELMTAFHSGLATGRGTKSEDLRAASLALLRSPRYAHPFYWAGFVLVGDPS